MGKYLESLMLCGVVFYKIFFKNKNFEDMSFFVGPLVPLFWTSVDVSSVFQSQSGQPYSHLLGAQAALFFLRFTFGATPADLFHETWITKCWILRKKQSSKPDIKSLKVSTMVRSIYRSGTVNLNTVNSKFHLIRSYCEYLVRFLSFHV